MRDMGRGVGVRTVGLGYTDANERTGPSGAGNAIPTPDRHPWYQQGAASASF